MQLYIIRHAQSQNNASMMLDEYDRVADPELTEVGHQQAEHLAEYLATAEEAEQIVTKHTSENSRTDRHAFKFTHLYCSPMHRSLQTARPIAAALGMKTEVWVDIHEHGGIFLEEKGVVTGYGGRTRLQILDEFPDYVLPDEITERGWWMPEHGREDLPANHARALRVGRALRERAAHDDTKDDRIAIVSHGTFIDSLLKMLYGILPAERVFHWHYNTAMTRVDILQDGVLIIRYVNRIPHLPPHLVT
jgi:broad specificity phosphatase PhoE